VVTGTPQPQEATDLCRNLEADLADYTTSDAEAINRIDQRL
jgi:hypothetical protein